MISTAKLTPDNIHHIKPVAYLGRGKIKAMAWVDHDTLAVVTLFALWHYTRDGGEREVLRFQEMGERANIVLSGRYILLWNGRTTLRIYDIADGSLAASVECGYISAERFICVCTADVSRVAFVHGDQVRVFDTPTGDLIANVVLAYILDIVFYEQQILILCGNGVVYHFDINTNEIVSRNFLKDETWMLEQWLLTQKLHPFYYQTVHYDARDILHPVKSGRDIQLWYNGLVRTFSGHVHPVWRVFFASKDKNTLVSYDRHENVFLWDVNTGQAITHTDSLGTDFIAVNPDLSAVAAVNGDYEVVIWNRETDEKHRFPHGHRKPARPFYLDHEVLLSTEDGWIYEWELASGKIRKKYNAAGKFFIMSSDRQYVAFVDQNDALHLHCLKTDQTRLMREACTPLLFTSNSLLYLVEAFQRHMSSHHGYNLNNTSSAHLTIMRVNLETGEDEIFLTIAPGNQVFFAPNGDYYAITVPSEGVSIFEVESQRLCYFLAVNVNQGMLIFTPNAKYVLIDPNNRRWNYSYTVWEVETGQPLETFNEVEWIAFSQNTVALQTYYDVVVWNKFYSTTFTKKSVSSLSFSPDGQFLLSYGTDYVSYEIEQIGKVQRFYSEHIGKIQVWDGIKPLFTLNNLSYVNYRGDFRIHEKLLAVGNTDCTITLWGVTE